MKIDLRNSKQKKYFELATESSQLSKYNEELSKMIMANMKRQNEIIMECVDLLKPRNK